MRLRALILVELDAADYAAAAQHQSTLESFIEKLRARYPQASLTIRERRERKKAFATKPKQLARTTYAAGSR
jgi:hypothetical protein